MLVFIFIHTLCMRAAKVLVSLCICTDFSESLLLMNLLIAIISFVGSKIKKKRSRSDRIMKKDVHFFNNSVYHTCLIAYPIMSLFCG